MKNKEWIKYALTSAVGIGIVFLVLQIRGGCVIKDAKEVVSHLSDAFFVSGILLACFGGLIFCSANGSFDGISYLFHILFVGHNWSKTNFKDKQTYREYVEEKNEKRSARTLKPVFGVVVGVIFIAIALVFLVIYHNIDTL